MNTDAQVIQAAYETQLAGAFETLFENSATEGIEVALMKFQNGLSLLRQARDRAKAAVGAGKPKTKRRR